MFCRQRVIHLFKRKSTGTSIRTNKIALIAGESLKWFTPKLKLVDPARTFANDNAFKEAWCTGSGLDYNIPWSIMESDVAKMPASGCHLMKGAFTSHMRMSRQFQNYSEGIVWPLSSVIKNAQMSKRAWQCSCPDQLTCRRQWQIFSRNSWTHLGFQGCGRTDP